MSCGSGYNKDTDSSDTRRKIGRGAWDSRVQFVTDANGGAFAYRPHQIITVRGALSALAALLGVPRVADDRVSHILGEAGSDDELVLVRALPNPLELARRLRAQGFRARPN